MIRLVPDRLGARWIRTRTAAGAKTRRRAVAILALSGSIGMSFLLMGCATSYGVQGTIRGSIGRATLRDIVAEVPHVLGASGFSVRDQHRTSGAISFETNWMYRAPFEDEAARGADAARTRLIVAARRSTGFTYAVRARAENEVRGVVGATDLPESTWTRIPATKSYEAYARELFLKIKLRIDAGVRIRGSPPTHDSRLERPNSADFSHRHR